MFIYQLLILTTDLQEQTHRVRHIIGRPVDVEQRLWGHWVKPSPVQLRGAPDSSALHASLITFAFSPLLLPEVFLVWAEISFIFYHYVKTASF